MGLKITEFYAYVSVDANGDEGLVAELIAGAWMPFVGADLARAMSLVPLAHDIARGSGQPIRLVRFSVREDLEEITPNL